MRKSPKAKVQGPKSGGKWVCLYGMDVRVIRLALSQFVTDCDGLRAMEMALCREHAETLIERSEKW